MQQELKKANPDSFSRNDIVYISIPDEEVNFNNTHLNRQKAKVFARIGNDITRVRVFSGEERDVLNTWLFYPPQPAEQTKPETNVAGLEKVIASELKFGDDVFYRSPKNMDTRNETWGKVWSADSEVHVAFGPHPKDIETVKPEYLFRKPKNLPVLITISSLLRELRGRKLHDLAEDMQRHFSKPENQYHPNIENLIKISGDVANSKTIAINGDGTFTYTPSPDTAATHEQEAEWVPEVGDIVITKGQPIWRNPKFTKYFGKQGTITKTENKNHHYYTPGYFVHESYWPLSSLTLVKKADKMPTKANLPFTKLPGYKVYDFGDHKRYVLDKEPTLQFSPGQWDN